MKLKALPPGTVLLECFYSVQASAPKKLQLHTYLPSTPIRVLRSSTGKDLTGAIKHAQLNKLQEHLKRSARFAIVKKAKPVLEKMLEQAQRSADENCQQLVEQAKTDANTRISAEIERLKALQALNGSARPEEIDFYEKQLQQTLESLDQAHANIEAVRVVINT
jgi:ATP-dependent helicase HepA